VSVARFVADQRTMYRVPQTVTCAILGISISWFHKWLHREPTERQRRRAALDARVRELFEASQGTYGSPRVHADLLEAGATVSVNTVADSMRRQGLQGCKPKRRRRLTRQDRSAPKFPDLVHRDFSAPGANVKWCGDITDIPTADEGKLYLASVLDLHSRRLLACATSEHPDAGLAGDAIKMAAAVRGGRAAIDGVIFHTDRGSTYTATSFTKLCRRLGVSQSMGRVGSCFDNAAAEAFFSTLEHEVLSRHRFTTKAQARQVVVGWCQDFYNSRRRHSSAALMSPIQYERLAADQPAAA
jgi:putative transposase